MKIQNDVEGLIDLVAVQHTRTVMAQVKDARTRPDATFASKLAPGTAA